MIIGEELLNLLKGSKNKIAKKLVEMSTNEPEWIGKIDYINIAISNPTKISFISKDRIDRFIYKEKTIDVLKEGTVVKLKGVLNKNKYTIEKLSYYNDKNELYYEYSYEGLGGNFLIKSSGIKYYNLYKKVSIYTAHNRVWDNDLRVKLAYMTTPGKFIKKLELEYSDEEIQEFSKIFYAEDIALSCEGLRFDIVSGRKIAYWYDERNYDNSSGTLGSSCMRHNTCQEYFEIYEDDEDIKMLILLSNETDKLLGRAMVWENVYFLEEDSVKFTYMDRIYTSNSNHEEYFKNYAVKNNWSYKFKQNYSDDSIMHPPYEEESDSSIVKVIADGEDRAFPYLDTFRSGDTKNGDVILYSNRSARYEFQNTEGGPWYERNTVYSEYESDDIDADEAVYSEWLGSYIYEHSSVLVEGDYMPEDHEEIVRINSRWYFIENCTYSDYYDEYIHEDIDTFVEVEYGSRMQNSATVYERDTVQSDFHSCNLLVTQAEEFEGDYYHNSVIDEVRAEREEELEEA